MKPLGVLFLGVLLALGGCGSDPTPSAPDAQPPDALRPADFSRTGDTADAADTGTLPDTPGAADARPDLAETAGPPRPDARDAAAPPDVASPGIEVVTEADAIALANGVLRLRYDLARGLFGVTGGDGRERLADAEARVQYTAGGRRFTVGTSAATAHTFTLAALSDRLGGGETLVVLSTVGRDGLAAIETRLDVRPGVSYLTVACTAHFAPDAPADARVLRLSPLVADGSNAGALYVGRDPATHRVLDNGTDLYFDFEAQVRLLGRSSSVLFPPGIAANWTAAVFDPASQRSVVAGFLSAERGVGLIGLHYSASNARHAATGEAGLTRFEGFVHYEGGRAPLPGDAGPSLASETFYVDFAPPDVFTGLEAFASRYAQRLPKPVHSDVPSGWNSWGGGGGSGGYGTDIDEARLLANLEAAARDFAPWGMRSFYVDAGWQIVEGDWEPNPDRFPSHAGRNGMAWLAEQIRAAGLTPGLWIAPFSVHATSELAATHPEWLATLGPFGVAVPADMRVLDLTRPDVLDWLAALFRRITAEWGYRFIKLDFSYYALFATELGDPNVTPSEAYHHALDVIREAIGPDVFLLTISATGLCLDVADGGRITLDNMPRWGDPQKTGDQGIKVTYRTVARRYYLNHHVWLNHPDLLFFRDVQGLTENEARAWTSAVALTGGIVKLGESYLDLAAHPEWRAQIYPLLPVYPHSGRPLDLFLREYPERWVLPVTRADASYAVLGLFNWGLNRDIGAADFDPERELALTATRAELGLPDSGRLLVLDAWDREWRFVDGELPPVLLAPRTARVFVVRPEPARPAVVFTTRHLLGGAVEVLAEDFDAAAGVLHVRLATVPGVPLTVFVALGGRDLVAAAAEPATAPPATETRDELALVTFTPAAAEAELTLNF